MDGQTVGVYEATDEEIPAVAGMNRTDVDENATLTVYATSAGEIVSLEYETEDASVELTVSDVGTTTVTEPDWVDDAREDAAPPRMGVTFELLNDGETLRITVSDAGNVDSFEVQSATKGTLQTTDSSVARVENPEVGERLEIALVTDEYDAQDDTVQIIASSHGQEGIVAVFAT